MTSVLLHCFLLVSIVLRVLLGIVSEVELLRWLNGLAQPLTELQVVYSRILLFAFHLD